MKNLPKSRNTTRKELMYILIMKKVRGGVNVVTFFYLFFLCHANESSWWTCVYPPPPPTQHRSDWSGLCLFCCFQPSCVVSQQSWFFFFAYFSNFTPPTFRSPFSMVSEDQVGLRVRVSVLGKLSLVVFSIDCIVYFDILRKTRFILGGFTAIANLF